MGMGIGIVYVNEEIVYIIKGRQCQIMTFQNQVWQELKTFFGPCKSP